MKNLRENQISYFCMLACYFLNSLILLIPSILIAQDTSRQVRSIDYGKYNEKKFIYGKSYAIIIGINNYKNEKIPPLKYAENDADSIAKVLFNLGFNVTNYRGREASWDVIMSELESLDDTAKYKSNDRIIIFFAGHGESIPLMHTSDTLAYILPYDADENKKTRSYIELEDVSKLMKNMVAHHALLIFDSCFSGSILNVYRDPKPPPFIEDTIEKVACRVITAGDYNEPVPDKEPGKFNSIFTGAVMRGIRGFADISNDGYITGMELGLFVREAVMNIGKGIQHPQIGTLFGKGDFIFVIDKIDSTQSIGYGWLQIESSYETYIYIDGKKVDDSYIRSKKIKLLPDIYKIKCVGKLYIYEEKVIVRDNEITMFVPRKKIGFY